MQKNILPKPLLDIFQLNRAQHDYNTRHQNDPSAVTRNYAMLDKSSISRGPCLWTNYPNDLKNKYTVQSFGRATKQLKIRTY